MRIQVRHGNPLHIGNEDIQWVDNFTYLGSMVSVTGGTEEDIIARIRKAQEELDRKMWQCNKTKKVEMDWPYLEEREGEHH